MAKKQESVKDRRTKAAEARAAQEAAEKRRDTLIKVLGGLAVLAVVGIIVGGAVWQSRGSASNDSGSAALPSPNPSAPLPTGVVATGDNAYAVPFGAGNASAPLMQVWEDFQCPACKAVEQANGAGIEKLATEGKVNFYWRPTAFLDAGAAVKADNQKNGNPNSSHRAIAAWGCAIDAGKTAEYHNAIYANQPAEGVGYSTATLIGFGKDVGISGDALTTFEKCVNDSTYLGWAVNSTQAFTDAGVAGTPTAFINGTEVQADVLADAAKLEAKIAEAAKK